MFILPLYVFLPIYFYFGKFPNLLGIPSMNFCFLEVNLCEMRFFNTVNPFIVLKNGSKILNSEPPGPWQTTPLIIQCSLY